MRPPHKHVVRPGDLPALLACSSDISEYPLGHAQDELTIMFLLHRCITKLGTLSRRWGISPWAARVEHPAAAAVPS